MIGKQVKGRSFRGALNYLLGKEGAEIIAGNMAGLTPRNLAAEFGEVRKLRPNLDRAVYHASLKSREFNRQVSEALYAHPSLDPFTSSLIDGSAYRSRLSHMPRLERHCPSL